MVTLGGGHWGGGGTQYLNTVRKKKYLVENRRNTDNDRSHLLNVVSILRVFYPKYTPESTSTFARKYRTKKARLILQSGIYNLRENLRSRIDRYNDRKARSMDVLPISS